MDQILISPEEVGRRAKSVGLSMKELSRRVGVAASTLARWRSGATQGINSRTYEAVVRELLDAERLAAERPQEAAE